MIKKGFYKKACKVAQNETISLKYVISTEEEKKKKKGRRLEFIPSYVEPHPGRYRYLYYLTLYRKPLLQISFI